MKIKKQNIPKKELKRHYTRREIKVILKNNGWKLIRQKGSHLIYENEQGNHIAIPRTVKDSTSIIFQRLIKENNLVI